MTHAAELNGLLFQVVAVKLSAPLMNYQRFYGNCSLVAQQPAPTDASVKRQRQRQPDYCSLTEAEARHANLALPSGHWPLYSRSVVDRQASFDMTHPKRSARAHDYWLSSTQSTSQDRPCKLVPSSRTRMDMVLERQQHRNSASKKMTLEKLSKRVQRTQSPPRPDRDSMSTSVYQFVSTMTPCFASEVLKPMTLSSSSTSSKPFAPFLTFQCGECPRQFSRRYALQEHLATHTGEKAYRCPAHGCGKRFTTTSNLARHRRMHGDELQPLACFSPGCTKTFTTQHKLQRHMRVHTGTPMRCCKFANCSKTFSSTGNLNRHMRNQHIRFGHPLTSEATKEEQSPTSVDIDPVNVFAWGSNSPTSIAMQITPIGEDLQLDTNSDHHVSDEELLEVLSFLLEDDEPQDKKEDATDLATATTAVSAS
ncbi:uncharacterized protein PITG_01387 [Phytophthora infestans T30-4]|uniref:C2H2-type domain-containing protein n=1 Tax=Phytophthora infestans (strain T30-4) TaxID=403677 RepID=D0MT43_PHYIT|nr:uncharacterized protein PITG_01387 [Phytophthora infestans T30-4]EEY61140.1 conserved hypothetical protein [Phytophthora infestans T30-4]|eukprot:XP_002908057.1 conserved hypothetical protein [Phytophthora infestans T30-4]